MKKLTAFLLFVFSYISVFAQPDQVEMADKFRTSGKIYVVIATIVIVFTGLAIYLFSMDRRLKKLEKQK